MRPGDTRKALAAKHTARLDHPVVHVSYRDALAYAESAGGSLPIEQVQDFSTSHIGFRLVYPVDATPDRQATMAAQAH